MATLYVRPRVLNLLQSAPERIQKTMLLCGCTQRCSRPLYGHRPFGNGLALAFLPVDAVTCVLDLNLERLKKCDNLHDSVHNTLG